MCLLLFGLENTHQKVILFVTFYNFLKSYVNISLPLKHRHCFNYGGRCYLSQLTVAIDDLSEKCPKQWVK
jgi:hypothetical protein